MSLHLERELPVSARVAFDAWLDPAALTLFMCPTAGTRVASAEVDARVGGEFVIVMNIAGATCLIAAGTSQSSVTRASPSPGTPTSQATTVA